MASKPPAKKSRTETDSFGPINVPAKSYWGAQTQRSIGNFRIGEDRMPAPLVRAMGIVKRASGRDQYGARLARYQTRPRHRARRAGGDRRHARVAFSAGGLADRLRHAKQHECQRSDLQPRDRNARRRDRLEKPGASERPCEYEPVVERQLPDRDAYRGGGRDRAPPDPRARRICSARCRKKKSNSPRS